MMHALNFGQPFVIDLGVDYQMSHYEGIEFLQQMKTAYSLNRSHWEPFNLFLCNYNPRNGFQRQLVEGNQTDDWLWNVTRRCFTDVFPKEKIVYLTSRSRHPLTNFSHDAVYVVGGTVDKRPGHIPINRIARVLLDQRDTPNLPWAFRHFARSRFTYRERAMNRIVMETEQIWEKKRSLLAPQVHDLSKYDLMSEEEYEEARRARDRFDDDGPNDRLSEYDDFGERRRSPNR